MNQDLIASVDSTIEELNGRLNNYTSFKKYIQDNESFINIVQLIETNDFDSIELASIMIKGMFEYIYHDVIYMLYTITKCDRLLSFNHRAIVPWSNNEYTIFNMTEIEL